MHLMGPAPETVRREGQHADQAADEIVGAQGFEKRPVPAVMLKDEQPDQQARGGNGQQETGRMARLVTDPAKRQGGEKQEGRRDQLEKAAPVHRAAIDVAMLGETPEKFL